MEQGYVAFTLAEKYCRGWILKTKMHSVPQMEYVMRYGKGARRKREMNLMKYIHHWAMDAGVAKYGETAVPQHAVG